MAKHTESLPLIIVAADFKFKPFDYDRFEIDYLKQYSDVVIWDLSYLSSKSFHKAISSAQYDGDDLKSINSYRQLFSEILFIKRNYNKKGIVVMNFVTPNSLASLFFLIAVKKLGLNSVKYYNSGVPNISSTNNNITIRYVTKALKRRFYLLLSKAFNIFPTHYIYAGDYWKQKYGHIVHKSGGKWLGGNTWDYSNVLSKIEDGSKKELDQQKTAVLLDGAGPMFGSDDVNIGKKTYITSEVWYPALVSFLEKIERRSNTIVNVAAHPKASHYSNPSCFGYRNVLYGKTKEMVFNSSFVITRGSTAISYAVIYKKPVVFIYSDQIKEDKLGMASVNAMSELLGTTPINIDGDLKGISDYLEVNEFYYDLYRKNYLSSSDGLRTNAQILLEDILFIPTEKIKHSDSFSK